jgi:hypothetical protein
MNFVKNVGLVDQIIRALLVLDLIIPCLLGLISSPLSYLMVSLAVILSASCVTGYCWIYDTLKISTNHKVNS